MADYTDFGWEDLPVDWTPGDAIPAGFTGPLFTAAELEAFGAHVHSRADASVAEEAVLRAAAIAGRAPLAHSHPTSGVTGLDAALATLTAADTALDTRVDALEAAPGSGGGLPGGGTPGQVVTNTAPGAGAWATPDVTQAELDAVNATANAAGALAATKLDATDPRANRNVTDPANLGAAVNVPFANIAAERWLPGTLNANLAITSQQPVKGSMLWVGGKQDATGNRSLTIDGVVIPIPAGPNDPFGVLVRWTSALAFEWESAGTADLIPIVNTAANRAITAADANKKVIMDNGATAMTATLPADATSPIPVGSTGEITRGGTGTVTFVAGAGATVNSEGGLLAVRARWTTVTWTKIAANTFLIEGNLA